MRSFALAGHLNASVKMFFVIFESCIYFFLIHVFSSLKFLVHNVKLGCNLFLRCASLLFKQMNGNTATVLVIVYVFICSVTLTRKFEISNNDFDSAKFFFLCQMETNKQNKNRTEI